MLSLFHNSFVFCVHLAKYDFSVATECCLISQKSFNGENNVSEKYIFMKYVCM